MRRALKVLGVVAVLAALAGLVALGVILIWAAVSVRFG